jgi:hypothetical protein
MIIDHRLKISDVAGAAARYFGAQGSRSSRARLTAALAFEDLRVVTAFAGLGVEKWGLAIELERKVEQLSAKVAELRRYNNFLETHRSALERELARAAVLLDQCADDNPGWRPEPDRLAAHPRGFDPES